MAEQDGVYVFEVPGRLLTSDRRASAIDEYHRALAQAAVEAILDGVEGYIVQGVQRRRRWLRAGPGAGTGG
jgi:hypothetical protein